MKQASIWYRSCDDHDRTMRDYPQMLTGFDGLTETLRSLDSQGFHIQRVRIVMLCDSCHGSGRERYRPKSFGRNRLPAHLLPLRECSACGGKPELLSEEIDY